MRKRYIPTYRIIDCSKKVRVVISPEVDSVWFFNIDDSKLQTLRWGNVVVKSPLNIAYHQPIVVGCGYNNYHISVNSYNPFLTPELNKFRLHHDSLIRLDLTH